MVPLYMIYDIIIYRENKVKNGTMESYHKRNIFIMDLGLWDDLFGLLVLGTSFGGREPSDDYQYARRYVMKIIMKIQYEDTI